MIIKLALLVVKKIPKADDALEEQLDDANKVVHVSRPDPGRIKSPIRIIKTADESCHHNKNICPKCQGVTTCRCSAPKTNITHDLCWTCSGKKAEWEKIRPEVFAAILRKNH